MSSTRIVDIAAMPGAQEADERAAELAWRLPAELAPLARIALDYRWSWDPDGPELFRALDPHACFLLHRGMKTLEAEIDGQWPWQRGQQRTSKSEQ